MKAYQLKIQIEDSHPPIWRRVIVPGGLSFSQFSAVLNEVMGWCGFHLYSFEFKRLRKRIEEVGDEDFAGLDGYEVLDAAQTQIELYLDSEEVFTYIYDFGDNWEHKITVEKVLDGYDKNYARVVQYKGNTPMEDCGGIYGYYHMVDVLKNPEAPEYEEIMEWTGGEPFVEYDQEEVNKRLEELGMNRSEKADEYSLYEIFASYQKRDLTEIAKLHHLQGYSKYRKEQLQEFLVRGLIDPDVMRRYFKYINDNEFQLLEEGHLIIDTDEAEKYAYLIEGGYVGCTDKIFSSEVIVPLEVKAAYAQYFETGWEKERKSDWGLLSHLNAAAMLNGVCPVEKALELYRFNTKEPADKLQVRCLYEDVPENKKSFIIKESKLILKEVEGKTEALLSEQGGVSFYMPTLNEAETLGSEGHFPFDRYMNELKDYFINVGGEEKEDADKLCYVIQYLFRNGAGIHEVVEFLEEEYTGYEEMVCNEKIAKAFFDKVEDVWRHTRMILYRGHHPAELLPQQEKQAEDNIIPFPVSGQQKVYPNDPCPCGSGKKYKYCCGKKK